MKKNNAGELVSWRFAWISAGIAIAVYSQKLPARKAVVVKASQRFRLDVKFPASVKIWVDRRARAKKVVAKTRITTNDLKCSGIIWTEKKYFGRW